MDFPFGYCIESKLPGGRELCSLLGSLVADAEDGSNNRFEVAAALNRRIAADGISPPPFWGHPQSRTYEHLTPTKPASPIPEYRAIEQRLRGRQIQSAFKLYGNGSVGSQAITGLASVDRMLKAAGASHRAVLWPFETRWGENLPADAIVFAEIWPTLGNFASPQYDDLRIKDARQVAAMVDWARERSAELERALSCPPDLDSSMERQVIEREGWILGAPAA